MKKVIVILCALSLVFTAKAQFGVNVGVSGLRFKGDVGKGNNTNFSADSRMGYNLGFDYRIGKILGLGLNGVYGTLAGTDNSASSQLNFTSKVMGGEFNIYGFFDRLSDTEKVAAPFISVGLGYLKFDPYGDVMNENNIRYHYWSDGSIRDLPEATANDPYAITLRRDYTYETQLKDTAVSYSRGTMYLPINVGLKFQAGFRTSIRAAFNYNLAFTDYIDNYKTGGNDSWMGVNLTVNISLAKKPKDIYSGIDFTAIDTKDYDVDGVSDDQDKCLGTPMGAKVDGRGCPVDDDGDDVPDYMDKEPNTKRGVPVDGEGVAINVEDVYRKQLEWDSLATVRSEAFNQMPTFTYLKEVESKAKEVKQKSGKENKIPDDLKGADLNTDNYISADEITKTIDGFFDGLSDFTVDKINRLIDFFFEQ
jgi:hypothetical protein